MPRPHQRLLLPAMDKIIHGWTQRKTVVGEFSGRKNIQGSQSHECFHSHGKYLFGVPQLEVIWDQFFLLFVNDLA